MARVTYVKKAQQRYEQVPVIDPATGEQKRTPVMNQSTGEQKTTKNGRPVFLNVTEADKSKPLPNLTCEKCDTEIKVGSPYQHVSPKSGPYGGRKRVRCADCPTWQHFELSSSKMATIWEAQYNIEFTGDLDDVKATLEDFASTVRGVAEEYEESAQSIEDGFGHEVPASEELREKAGALEGWADDLESWDPPNGDEFEEEEYEVDEDLSGDEAEEAKAAWAARQEEAKAEWLQEIYDAASDAVNEDPI